MAYGRPDFITTRLLDDDTMEHLNHCLPDGYRINPRQVRAYSRPTMFGSTAGPWGGIGGAAMTTFQITMLVQGNLAVVFVDEKPFGYTIKPGAGQLLIDGDLPLEGADVMRFPQ
ncbi:hypothetical protein IV500_04215 [Paeniglutamicibacter antarcticus]|uniref:Uncharacterized protein n=1 Tax=Arthrobacter terrae TaxID=2935737 RepID=A0A931G4P1_9MICC|nr:hypothetical protein [Arthrobacter terrae]MBG0738625.1 hypothetical protein [Arthrobacter terrae]